MATTVNLNSTYAGHELIPLLVPMFDNLKEVRDGHVQLHNDVNFKKALRRMQVDGILGAESAAFTPVGDVTIDEKVLFPTIREVNLQLEKDEFRSEWASQRMGKGQLTKQMAAEINEAVVKNILGKVGAALGVQMWTAAAGSADPSQLPDGGLRTQIKASIEAAGAGTDLERAGYVDGTDAITATNVLGELNKVLSAMKPAALSFGETRLFVASDVWFAYTQAIGDQANTLNSTTATPMSFGGYQMVVVKELAAGEIIAANKDNLHYGTDIFSDANYVEMIDLSHTTGDRYVRFIQKVAIDVKVGFTAETVARIVATPGTEA